jgi:hypothetical protein
LEKIVKNLTNQLIFPSQNYNYPLQGMLSTIQLFPYKVYSICVSISTFTIIITEDIVKYGGDFCIKVLEKLRVYETL